MSQDWTWNTRKRQLEEDDEDGQILKYCKVDVQDVLMEAKESGKILAIECNLTPSCCNMDPFTSTIDYEDHYENCHMNECSECNRILPTSRLLHLHLLEVHDSYFRCLAERQHSYECFVDGCDRKSLTPDARIRHLVEKHKYPKEFDFDVVLGYSHKTMTDPKHSRRNNKRRAKKRKSKDYSDDMEISQLTQSFVHLMVPNSISFGGRGKKKNVTSFEIVRSIHRSHAPHRNAKKKEDPDSME